MKEQMKMRKTVKAKAIMKLLKQGYSPSEITRRIDASYNYAWKLKRLMMAGVEADALGIPCSGECEPKHEPEVASSYSPQDEAIARIAANRHEVPEHQQHLITEHEWDGHHDRVWCKHGIDQLGEMCEVCYPEAFGKASPVDKILNERASNYGSFLGLSQVTQRLKAVAHQFAGQNNKTFAPDQAEALDLIFTKVGRILNGDPNHIDSWLDIAGYATLVADRLQGKTR
jgi:hypothetical protein